MVDKTRLINLCREIAEDAEADVYKYERAPFDGKTVAAYQGEQNAMIAALANILKETLSLIP